MVALLVFLIGVRVKFSLRGVPGKSCARGNETNWYVIGPGTT
jgi:hypothetical protein